MSTHRYRILGLLCTLLVTITGCAAPQAGPDRAGSGASAPITQSGPKRITVAIPNAPAVLDNRFDTSTNKIALPELTNLYSAALTVYDDQGQLTPQLSEGVPTVENGWTVSADGTMQTAWTIKRGVTWHDGTPVTTRDLLFTDEVMRDRSLPQVIAPSLTYLDRLEAPDARTIVAHWK